MKYNILIIILLAVLVSPMFVYSLATPFGLIDDLNTGYNYSNFIIYEIVKNFYVDFSPPLQLTRFHLVTAINSVLTWEIFGYDFVFHRLLRVLIYLTTLLFTFLFLRRTCGSDESRAVFIIFLFLYMFYPYNPMLRLTIPEPIQLMLFSIILYICACNKVNLIVFVIFMQLFLFSKENSVPLAIVILSYQFVKDRKDYRIYTGMVFVAHSIVKLYIIDKSNTVDYQKTSIDLAKMYASFWTQLKVIGLWETSIIISIGFSLIVICYIVFNQKNIRSISYDNDILFYLLCFILVNVIFHSMLSNAANYVPIRYNCVSIFCAILIFSIVIVRNRAMCDISRYAMYLFVLFYVFVNYYNWSTQFLNSYKQWNSSINVINTVHVLATIGKKVFYREEYWEFMVSMNTYNQVIRPKYESTIPTGFFGTFRNIQELNNMDDVYVVVRDTGNQRPLLPGYRLKFRFLNNWEPHYLRYAKMISAFVQGRDTPFTWIDAGDANNANWYIYEKVSE